MNRSCLKVHSGTWTLVGSHWTAPCVMIREGILAGSDGPQYWDAEVIRAMASLWDGVPVVVGHPMGSNGKPVSVKSRPESIIGRVKDPVYDSVTKSLRATIKIPAGLNGIHQIMALKEVSVGVFTDSLFDHGQYKGQRFIGRTLAAIPDHLAILPEGQIGACSWSEHGCGIRAHKGEQIMMNHEHEAVLPPEVYAASREQDELQTLREWENFPGLPPVEITALRMKHGASRQRPGSGHAAHAMYPPGAE